MARRSLAAFLSLLAAARAGTVGFAGTYVSRRRRPTDRTRRVGSLGAALGAPETTETARLPATSLIKPPRRLALLVAAPPKGSAGLGAPQNSRRTRTASRRWARPSAAARGRRPPRPGGVRGRRRRRAGALRRLARAARRDRRLRALQGRRRAARLIRIEKGGSVAADGAVAFPKVGKVDEPLVEEVAALVEYAR